MRVDPRCGNDRITARVRLLTKGSFRGGGHHDQALLDSVFCQPGNAVNIQLPHNAFAVSLNRADADGKTAGDFLVAEALRDGNEDFALAVADGLDARLVGSAANKLV